MKPFRKRVTPTLLVSDEVIHFILQGGGGDGKTWEPVPLDPFLAGQVTLDDIPRPFLDGGDCVMIVPDYWVGNLSMPFQTRKGTLAEAFLQRKLREELPELPEAKDFFGFLFYQADPGEKMLYAYFLREQKGVQLYEHLARWNLRPRRITTAAFLWEARLKEEIPDFQRGGKAFALLLSSECYLYFFFEGRFLFSRRIALPEFRGDASEQLDTLNYETQQSLYLFSQKVKVQIDRVYMASLGHVDAGELSGRLGREVEVFGGMEKAVTEQAATTGSPGLLSGFCLPDLSRSQNYRSISHRQVEKEQQWKPVQKVGIAVGLILLLLLTGEGFVLWKWGQPVGPVSARGGGAGGTESAGALRQYNEALDLFLEESRRPAAGKAIVDLARAMPEDVWIREMVVETEPNPAVVFKGTVRAADPARLREVLTGFLDHLNHRFHGGRFSSLGLKDIAIDTDDCRAGDGYRSCAFALEFALP